MGFFDDLMEEFAFTKDAAGNTIFYDWGPFGSSFIVKSEETREQIRNFYKKGILVGTIVLSPAVIWDNVEMGTWFGAVPIDEAAGYWLSAVLIPFNCVWYYCAVNKITKNLPKTKNKLRISEFLKNSARSYTWSTLIFLELFSVSVVAEGIFFPYSVSSSLFDYLASGFFGLCAIGIGYMLLVKRRQNSAGESALKMSRFRDADDP